MIITMEVQVLLVLVMWWLSCLSAVTTFHLESLRSVENVTDKPELVM